MRTATNDDDLSALLGELHGFRLNRAQVLVMESGERIEGLLILWDGGHAQIRVDSLIVHHDAPSCTSAKLIAALFQYCRVHHISDMLFCTASKELADMARKRGGYVSAPMMQVQLPVPQEEG